MLSFNLFDAASAASSVLGAPCVPFGDLVRREARFFRRYDGVMCEVLSVVRRGRSAVLCCEADDGDYRELSEVLYISYAATDAELADAA